jgi:hypothetical protein
MFIWRLGAVLEAEGSIGAVVDRACAAGVDGLLIKIAEGAFAYRNTEGELGEAFVELREACRQAGIAVWGWHVPRCATTEAVAIETAVVEGLAQRLALDGLIMDAEPGDGFFQGNAAAAEAYGAAMRRLADTCGGPLGICSLALPDQNPGWLERLARLMAFADVSFPQTYYGATPSTARFLAETEMAHAGFGLPIVPVGAAWVGDDGGCVSALDCASRAREFIDLCHHRDDPGHAFWQWAAAPPEFWEVLAAERV